MSGEGKRRDVVRLHERCVKQIAQRNVVARLKTDVVFRNSGKGGRRNADDLIKISAVMFRPIQHHHGGGNFGQTADLAFLLRFVLFKDMSGSRIDDDVTLRRTGGTGTGAREKRERGENGNKAMRKHSGGVRPQTLISAF